MIEELGYPADESIRAATVYKRQRDNLLQALCSIGVVGNGYCFCSNGRNPDKKKHQPECAEARAIIAEVEG